jgi:hypothetical protein
MRRLWIVALALVAAVAVAVPALAAGNRMNVPQKFAKVLPKVKQKSGIPVLIPTYLDAGAKPSRIFGQGSAKKGEYLLELGFGKNCTGGNACFVAAFIANKGAKPIGKIKLKLTHGITGYYHQGGCGANCAPDGVEWKQGGVLYEVQMKASQAKIVRLANQSIKAGPR